MTGIEDIYLAMRAKRLVSSRRQFALRWLGMSRSYMSRQQGKASERAYLRLWMRLNEAGHYDIAGLVFEKIREIAKQEEPA